MPFWLGIIPKKKNVEYSWEIKGKVHKIDEFSLLGLTEHVYVVKFMAHQWNTNRTREKRDRFVYPMRERRLWLFFCFTMIMYALIHVAINRGGIKRR